jgi:CheY-like chemotaxis protein
MNSPLTLAPTDGVLAAPAGPLASAPWTPPATSSETPRAISSATPPAPRTLLLVDDEPNVLAALKRLFRTDGYGLVTAHSGAQALECLAQTAVDVIVSDQRMPGMSGVDFLRRARQLYPHTMRLTLSGYTDLQSIIDAVNEGAVYKFLTKPWDDDRLREHVAQAFVQKELADANRALQAELASANAELAALNRRLAQLLDRQRGQAQLLLSSARGAHDLVDALPAAVFGLDPEGMLVYLNPSAAALLPQALPGLGIATDASLLALLHALRVAPATPQGEGHPVRLAGRPLRAWLSAIDSPGGARGEILMLLPGLESDAP